MSCEFNIGIAFYLIDIYSFKQSENINDGGLVYSFLKWWLLIHFFVLNLIFQLGYGEKPKKIAIF